MDLTPKQAAFVREYCVDGNGAQAAIRAGYAKATARQIAAENLTKPYIRAAVDAKLSELAAKTETDAEWVRRRLKEEGEDFSEGASSSARVRAIELIGKINGIFEADNRQKAGIFDSLAPAEAQAVKEFLDELSRTASASVKSAARAD